MSNSNFTDAELLEQYARTGLAQSGMSFEATMAKSWMVLALKLGIQIRREAEAKRARSAAINYQAKDAA